MVQLASNQINNYLTKKLIQDLVIECNNATQVVVKAGSTAGADDGSIVMEAAGDLTVEITASGDLGLDTGTEAINTWYYVWLIWRPDTEAVSAIISASSTSPALPAGYTKKRLVSAVRNDGSSNLLKYIQLIDRVLYKASHVIYNLKSNSLATIDVNNYVPFELSKEAIIDVHTEANSSITGMYVNVHIAGEPGPVYETAWGYVGNVDSGPSIGSSVIDMMLVAGLFDIKPGAAIGVAWSRINISGYRITFL